MKNNIFLQSTKFLTLPILLGIYPIFFLYANNVGVVSISSAIKLFILTVLFVVIIYFFVVFLGSFQYIQAANSSFTFVLFFLFYGLIFDYLMELDIFHLEHFSFLPFFLVVAIYFSWIIFHLNLDSSYYVWKSGFFIISGLLLFNIVPLIPVVAQSFHTTNDMNTVISETREDISKSPDIYYIIFDEMAGFEVVRQYWQYEEISEFTEYLKAKGFYVAESSFSSSTSTIHQMASRLNYQEEFQPSERESTEFVREQKEIANSQVMQYLKSRGYTTVVFANIDAPNFLPGMPSINADVVYNSAENKNSQQIVRLDDFANLFLENTLLKPWLTEFDLKYSYIEDHRNFTLFAIGEISSLEVPSPKFVYAHILLPHVPFIFDREGSPLEYNDSGNWNRYIDQYIYSTTLAKQLIDDITYASTQSDVAPVIIFQSDHGARNIYYGNEVLKDYPDEYKTWIVNTMLLPNCDNAPLTQDMNPINTFPIVFNCYFDADIPLK